MAATAGQPFSVLEHGRQLYGGACSACHAPYPAANYSSPQWHDLIADMGERAKLSSADSNAVLAYVLAARAATPPTQQ
jgi:mono/diheme cytochrome c family protein